MSGILLPILLFVGAVAATFFTYRNIRRGGARFYTLEREIVLRRALVTLTVAAALYTASLSLLYFQRQQLINAALPPTLGAEAADGTGSPLVTTPTPMLEVFPPSPEPTSLTPEPTATATPTVCRAVVEGTGGNGLYLRSEPQGEQLVLLSDGTLLTVLEEPSVEAGGILWRKVRAVGGEEGWAADQFLTIRAPCSLE